MEYSFYVTNFWFEYLNKSASNYTNSFWFVRIRFNIGDQTNSVDVGVCSFSMREVHRSHVLVIKIFDREISKSTTIGKPMPSDIDFSSYAIIVDIIFTPIFLPSLGFESDWERACHLDGFADWQMRSCFLIEES